MIFAVSPSGEDYRVEREIKGLVVGASKARQHLMRSAKTTATNTTRACSRGFPDGGAVDATCSTTRATCGGTGVVRRK